jgi:hypothetical protein
VRSQSLASLPCSLPQLYPCPALRPWRSPIRSSGVDREWTRKRLAAFHREALRPGSTVSGSAALDPRPGVIASRSFATAGPPKAPQTPGRHTPWPGR